MDHTEVSLPGVVAKPFLDEFAVLIEVPDTRGAALVSDATGPSRH
jgi:hypothetical protein